MGVITAKPKAISLATFADDNGLDIFAAMGQGQTLAFDGGSTSLSWDSFSGYSLDRGGRTDWSSFSEDKVVSHESAFLSDQVADKYSTFEITSMSQGWTFGPSFGSSFYDFDRYATSEHKAGFYDENGTLSSAFIDLRSEGQHYDSQWASYGSWNSSSSNTATWSSEHFASVWQGGSYVENVFSTFDTHGQSFAIGGYSTENGWYQGYDHQDSVLTIADQKTGAVTDVYVRSLDTILSGDHWSYVAPVGKGQSMSGWETNWQSQTVEQNAHFSGDGTLLSQYMATSFVTDQAGGYCSPNFGGNYGHHAENSSYASVSLSGVAPADAGIDLYGGKG
jgi:hypothetical protein